MVSIDQLENIQFLQDMPEDILKKISALARLKTFETKTVLVYQNEEHHRVYMLAAGKVCLNTRSGAGRVLTLDEIVPGQSFGLSALLGNATATLTAVCEEPCEVITLSGDRMKRLFASDFAAGSVVMRRVAQLFKGRMDKHTRQFLHSLSIHPAITGR